MKKLITMFAFLFISIVCNSQEKFNGNWEPKENQKWFNDDNTVNHNTKEFNNKNFNVFAKNLIITSYLTEKDYLKKSKNNPTKKYNKSYFKQKNEKSIVLFSNKKNIKTLLVDPDSNNKIYINYYLKTKNKIIATYIDFKTNKVRSIVVYKKIK